MSDKSGKDDPVDIELIRKLADLLAETGLTEIEVENGPLRVKVSRGGGSPGVEAIQHWQAAPALISHTATPPAPAEPKGDIVKSPMVGTVYLQTNPGSPPFVQPGDRVAEGQTLMIIEAMKTMNPVPAPRAGLVLEILVDDAQPVGFGEPLVVLE